MPTNGESIMATQNITNPLSFRHAKRLQESLLAGWEKRLLVWMAEHTPAWIGPDHLTVLGFAAQKRRRLG